MATKAPTNLNEYYTGQGKALPSISDRGTIFEKQGLGGAGQYTGTAEQNTALLQKLTAQPSPTTTPSATPSPSPSPLIPPPATPVPATPPATSTGTPPPTTPPAPTSKYEQGFNQANQAMGGATPKESEALSIINQYSPSTKNDMSSAFVQSDPQISNLVSAWQEYTKPENQRKSLADTYKGMLKDSGIEEIDTELINAKNIIDGTEDDIRTELVKASGYASESQIQSMVLARNKQLIKNYNTLLDHRNAKEKYLQTSLQLEEADRKAADQRFESMFNMGVQIADYQQKMKDNAQKQMQWLSTNIGFDGLFDATEGNPYYTNLVEKTLGLPSGGLATAAEQARLKKAQAEESRLLDIKEKQVGLQLKGEQIKTEQAQRAKIYNEISTSGMTNDPAQILAYAQQYASTGNIPTGLPKGTFGLVANAAKILPKAQGQILDRATGVTPDKLGAAGDAYGALYSAIELSKQLKELDKKKSHGLVGGVLGKVFGSEDQQRYLDLKNQIVDLLARARSGAALTLEEERRYSNMLPGRVSNALFLGTSSEGRIDNFTNALSSDLNNKINTKGWVVNGFSKVNIGGQDYTVGDTVQNEQGQSGTVLPDGSIYF